MARSFLLLSLLALGCSSSTEEVGASAGAIALDRVSLPTLRTTLQAGDPYSPFSDERPLAIGGQSCLSGAKLELGPGATEVSASILASRRDLMNRLDLGIEGVPISVGKLAGATGTARLAIDTELDERSLNLMFQAKGTYETQLVGVGAAPAPFDPTQVKQCGWGYVEKAYHRLSAIVLVTIESSDGTSRIRLGCGEGEQNCTPTSISAGPLKARAALETMLKNGHFEVTVRSVADVIPGLTPTPLGDMVTLSSSPENAADVLARLDSALTWLGNAQAQISKRIDDIHRDPAQTPAPTIKVDFAYWPGMDTSLRERAASAYDRITALRNDDDVTRTHADTWDAFDDDRAAGFAYLYQTPSAPVATTDDLAAREGEARAALDAHRRELDRRLDECDAAARNDAGLTTAGALVDAVGSACAPVTALTWDPRWDVRRLAPVSVAVKPYDEWRDIMCPDGQRIPTIDEAPLLGPWSFQASVWLRREWIGVNPVYVSKGKVERVGLFQAPAYVTACFDASAPSLFE